MAFFGLFGKKKETLVPPQGDIPEAYYDTPVPNDSNLGLPGQDDLALPQDQGGDYGQGFDPYQSPQTQVHDMTQDMGQQNSFEQNFPRQNQSFDESQYQIRDVTDGPRSSPVQEQTTNAVQEVQIVKIEKNLEIISAKIDTLRTVLDNMDQRMKHLETLAANSDSAPKTQRPHW